MSARWRGRVLVLEGEYDSTIDGELQAAVEQAVVEGRTRLTVDMTLLEFLRDSLVGSPLVSLGENNPLVWGANRGIAITLRAGARYLRGSLLSVGVDDVVTLVAVDGEVPAAERVVVAAAAAAALELIREEDTLVARYVRGRPLGGDDALLERGSFHLWLKDRMASASARRARFAELALADPTASPGELVEAWELEAGYRLPRDIDERHDNVGWVLRTTHPGCSNKDLRAALEFLLREDARRDRADS
ncbi:MAG: hypothetical protein QOD92_3922 [Acidimicrobiaceae bacterium]|jgi:hypothetical protein